MDDEDERPRRPRNAVTTRAAILDAARVAFTDMGYASAGVRDIAAVAGVNAALVIRYFGSKEGLFAASVAEGFEIGDLLAGDRATFGERLAWYLFLKEQGGGFDPLLMLCSASNAHAAPLLREALDTQFVRPLAAWLGGKDATVRAGLIAAYLTGLSVLRGVLRSESLATAEGETFVALVAPVLQAYADGVPVRTRSG